jgi:outer membrane lipoprotein-sorting protein
MLRELAGKWPGLSVAFWFLLIMVLPSTGCPQTADGVTRLDESRADAFTFLKQVGQRYANATYYRIEAVTEEQMNADFSKNWSKSLTTAGLAPGNKHRFEAHTNWEWWVLVSDGQTEWLYSPAAQEYRKQAAPARGSTSRFKSSGLLTFLGLTEAQDTIEALAELPSSVRTAFYLPDETLTLNGKQVNCYVIGAQGKYRPGWSPDTTFLLTVWVDKENHAIRKVREHMEGPLIMSHPQEHYVSDKTTVYPIVELDAPAFPGGFFTFAPPSTTKLVTEFEQPMWTQREALIVGKPAPDGGP